MGKCRIYMCYGAATTGSLTAVDVPTARGLYHARLSAVDVPTVGGPYHARLTAVDVPTARG